MDSIYTITITGLNIGEWIEYKFRINSDWATAEFPDGGSNRFYTIIDGENIINHWYNDKEPDNFVGFNAYYDTQACSKRWVTFENISVPYDTTGTIHYEWWLNETHYVGFEFPDIQLYGGDYYISLEMFEDGVSIGYFEDDFQLSGLSGNI